MDGVELAAAIARAAREIDAVRDVDDVLTTIVEVAASSLPGIQHAGVSLVHRDGRMETRAGSSDLVWQLDELQYELHEGPCLDAILSSSGPVVTVNHLRDEQRWQRYVPRALEYGVRAQMGLRLFTHERVHGGLNLYATASDEIDPTVEATAELLALHAAMALGHARREADLNRALATREQIGHAVGIVMHKYQVNAEVAFSYLTRVSQTTNVKLRDVAAQIVAGMDPATSDDAAHEQPT